MTQADKMIEDIRWLEELARKLDVTLEQFDEDFPGTSFEDTIILLRKKANSLKIEYFDRMPKSGGE